jgi:hypothetical protein
LIFLYFHARARGELLHGFLEIQPFALHHELENIAALVALTETPPGARFGPDHESRRMFILMERTKARIVLARMTQFDTGLGNEVDNIDAGLDLINCRHGCLAAFNGQRLANNLSEKQF